MTKTQFGVIMANTSEVQAAWEKYWSCYQLSVQAESAFTAEVVRQFGAKRAGDMRYVSSAFDHATNSAAVTKHAADAARGSALEYARSFPVINPLPVETSATAAERAA